MSLNFISNFFFFFFQNKGFHFYYCNYCGECLNSMTEENIQAHLNDCSQHSSKFICRECGMVSENFLVAPFLIQNFTIFKKLYCSQHSSKFICRECGTVSENFLVAHALLFNFNYSHCFFRSMKHLTQASHPYLQRETTKKWSKKMMK